VYEPLTDGHSNRHIHFIQLVNMVTGRGYMDINRISGYIPGKIVFFLMQVCLHACHALAHLLTLQLSASAA
jgi:6-phosphofructo-2-kinase / fructose-2,6-biphosphatase 3